MGSVYSDILKWAKKLEYWEQAALCKVILGESIDEDDVDELLQYLLQDAGLEDIPSDRPNLEFGPEVTSPSKSYPVILRKISNLRNINALVPDQELFFSEGITAIYGRNGSGKSGYARVLGAAGFTRGEREILPDVSSPEPVEDGLTAEIEFSQGDATYSITYNVEHPCAELASLYVFDSTSVQSHLGDSNPYSFSPAGLSLLTELAKVTDLVRNKLDKQIELAREAHQFQSLFIGPSWVSELIQILGPSTSLEFLEQVATIPDPDFTMAQSLDLELAELKAQKVDDELQKLDLALSDLEVLTSSLTEITVSCDESQLTALRSLIEAASALSSELSERSKSSFVVEGLKRIGSEEWFRFISSAKELATAEEADGDEYPQPGNRCLLCHQDLSLEAIELIRSFWDFLQSETKREHENAIQSVGQKLEALMEIDRSFYGNDTSVFRYLSINNESLHRKVEAYLQSLFKRIDELVSFGRGKQIAELSPFSASPLEDLNKSKADIEAVRNKLAELKVAERIAQIDEDIRVHEHRVIFRERWPGLFGQ